ncbi:MULTISPECIES: acetyl-CoA carboxylase carboxyltransferase subunit alpha [Bradyrhizobium]|jgi:acetyl-CoA carboxylase carboxyl transferase subunit alpha|uniref:acetyl-CoA carboxylase carboxyltransferase subunit alpha n=1 Tax=Bradyrhizobium TaxID=374 RepID=UPI000426DFB8|nr:MULTISPECIES: acetyl-CoA carboxylase carboxyltransferase subunit alpha [Bradyrhizobium]AUC93600.1 acetyl-CoA carboxylase carboxyltransferase subunit alpha [Bradyrhizobium sp. SK17]KIU49767.1 acetyl-CoA carboxylase subunit alpha [Bradyrhizobium elkanii]OCX32154.1 acetyl-CoA carboxylase carboxyltransferase subunit alpha [Bradyrhizobium sp. UASWS1016]
MPDPMRSYLDFEKPVAELESKIDELRTLAASGSDIGDEVARIEDKAAQALTELYANLTPWQKTQVARHPQRPHFTDFVGALITEFTPMAGDRKFADDEALIGGFGRFRGESICVVGQEKGGTTESRIKHNFGMARPEGYRKAVRLMEMADRFGIPVLSIVDSAGAYPGIGAEERGQAEAIARSIDACLSLGVPNVAIVTGEGMSGGAIAITTANRVLMMEHAIYSVITPEAASSILWRDGSKAQEAANSMKITAQDMLRFGVIDQVLKEPAGGAHRDPAAMIATTGDAVAQALNDLRNLDPDAIRKQRRQKFLDIGRKLG